MLGLALNSASVFLFKSPSVNYVYHKMLLNENECYLVIVAKQILLVTINSVYGYKTRNNISGGGGGGGGGGRVVRWSWVNFQCRGVLQFGI